jgi:hypothetical protein
MINAFGNNVNGKITREHNKNKKNIIQKANNIIKLLSDSEQMRIAHKKELHTLTNESCINKINDNKTTVNINLIILHKCDTVIDSDVCKLIHAIKRGKNKAVQYNKK